MYYLIISDTCNKLIALGTAQILSKGHRLLLAPPRFFPRSPCLSLQSADTMYSCGGPKMRLTRLRCVSCCARKCILGENMAKYIQLGIYLDVLVEGTRMERLHTSAISDTCNKLITLGTAQILPRGQQLAARATTGLPLAPPRYLIYAYIYVKRLLTAAKSTCPHTQLLY